jgi:hypothetical protein
MPAVYPVEWVSPAFRGHYRHMAKRDAAVWESFLRVNPDRFDAYSYDVALGGVTFDDVPMEDHEAAGWRYSTALKIDVVGRAGDVYWIIEVRPDAHVSAFGAALAYTLVAERDQVFPGSLVPAVVCNSVQPDVQWTCQRLGVQVMVVPIA